jgi:hypothetical protein
MSEKSLENELIFGFPAPGRGRTGLFVGHQVAEHGNCTRTGSNEAGWVYIGWQPGPQNGNSRFLPKER